LNLILDLMKAVCYAHQRNVAHRNLSPKKIFLNNIGQLKTCDWGTAKLLDKFGLWSRTSKPSQPNAFCAPELYQVVPGRYLDVFSLDVYSLGLILLIICGVHPETLNFIDKSSRENHDYDLEEVVTSSINSFKGNQSILELVKKFCRFEPKGRPDIFEAIFLFLNNQSKIIRSIRIPKVFKIFQ
jgi:serine/threonine protein kinase